MKPSSQKANGNILLRMHPLQRILLSVFVATAVYACIYSLHLKGILNFAIIWDAFSFSFVVCSWIVLITRPLAEIVKLANKEDGSRFFILILILLSSFASMVTVLLLMISKGPTDKTEILTVILAISGMMLSWTMVHTIFTFHYAHLYYDQVKNHTPGTKALDFPAEEKPNYLDFAYFAFVIGMTFQVSDVEISSGRMRRTVLAHSLLSFALNTFVVALTINLIAGLSK